MRRDPAPAKLGVLAGAGDLPARLIAAARKDGRDVFVIAFEGHTPPDLVSGGVDHAWVRLGAAGAAIKALKKAGATDLVLAGAIRRPGLKELRPDLTAARILAKVGAAALGDDNLLRAIVKVLEEEQGFRVLAVEDILPDLLVPSGLLGRHAPDDEARADMTRAAAVARALGRLDVGQGAVVQQGLVLAVEALEGTDAMLERCAGLRRDGPGGVLVKVRKPQQDQRADLPTVGVATVNAAAAAGLRGIGVEAGGALIVDPDDTIAAADAAGLFLVGLDPP
ncbi:MAG: UDP-2,3-diacylglucosamine diphosphatase LpxI [Rhodobacterales bacterium]|nr:UDP-2,3-diacylglucosamine diphosphatase LpxI [Rhodobacterales bacterium]